VKTAPAAAIKMAQAEFPLQFLVIAFDDQALFAKRDQVTQRDNFRLVRNPVFARLGFPAGPFDEQAFLAQAHFSADLMARRTAELYDQLLERRANRAG
jgi:hypothetical protein